MFRIFGIVLFILITFLFHSCKKDKEKDKVLLPIIETIEVSSITSSSATIRGKVISEGGAHVLFSGVCWSSSTNPTVEDDTINCGTGTGEFTCLITGLKLNSIFYVRAFATNSKGISYGNELKFTTLDYYEINYIIELDNANRLIKVTYGSIINTYNYSDKEVKIITNSAITGNVTSINTYFLNARGLADSSVEGTKRIQYQYNNDNYLISLIGWGLPITYTYLDGNRINAWKSSPPYWIGLYYTYNSLLNLVDIDSFTGPWLGKLNRNLVLRMMDRFGPMAGNEYNIVYSYVLNNEGFVVQRTEINDYETHYGLPAEKTISNFQYKFVK
jgi:hypothetical protein